MRPEGGWNTLIRRLGVRLVMIWLGMAAGGSPRVLIRFHMSSGGRFGVSSGMPGAEECAASDIDTGADGKWVGGVDGNKTCFFRSMLRNECFHRFKV